MRSWKLSVGVALGGGAARGLAHIGVLRVLQRERIPVHVITGTSMGAIVGGAFAAHAEVDELEGRVRDVLGSESFRKTRVSFLRETKRERGGLFFSVANLVRRGIFFGVSNLRPSFLSAQAFADSMAAVVPDVKIEDLELCFGAVCLDLNAAEEVLLCRGSLRRAASASSAIPGILPPVQLNGRNLIDGGWIDKIPVLPAFRLGADIVIAVDITADLLDLGEYRRGVDIMLRANAIRDDALVAFSRRMADVVIEPDVGKIHWADFGALELCIAEGERATVAALPRIRELLRNERLLSIVRHRRNRRLAELNLESDDLRLAVE